MKKLLILIAICSIQMIAHAQNFTIDSLTNQIKYDQVYNSPLSKETLFTKANEWVSTNFNNSKAVIDLSDKANGQLFIKGNFKTFANVMSLGQPDSINVTINFVCRFYLKDKKYKVVITDLTYREAPLSYITRNGMTGRVKDFYTSILSKSDARVVALMKDISRFMNAKTDSDF